MKTQPGWLCGLPRDVAKQVNARTAVRTNGKWHGSGRWSLRQSPSTRMARDADLILRDDFGRLVDELPVMRDGKPVPPFG